MLNVYGNAKVQNISLDRGEKHDSKHMKAYGIATLLFNVTTETPSASVKTVSLY